jgi:UDP-N-acetylmuramoylalanine--D-glutamate ligase
MGKEVFNLEDLLLVGAAGVEDALAAAGAALAFGIDERAVGRAMKSFRPLPHRMEIVTVIDDVTYIDDSKATNPHATLSAVRGLKDVVLIAGGRSKGIDLSVLEGVVPPVIAAVALGEAGEEVTGVLGPLVEVVRVASMDEAVAAAGTRAKPGGSVLLSPACASLDMYESYAARGEDFARAVRAVIEERGGDEVGNSN